MRLVVSILAPDLGALARRARAQAAFADAVELRFDSIANPGEEALRALVASIPRPVIVAVNGPEAHGSFRGTAAERFELLRAAARAGAAFVDVDQGLAAGLGALPASCRRIVSHHDSERTPDDLSARLAELRAAARGDDVLKLVTHATRAEDGLRMLALVGAEAERGRAFVGFTSGERGSFTRMLAPSYGSPWTYSAAARLPDDEAPPTAPGQLRADEIARLLPASAGPRTEIYAVLGRPARHSLSPRLHNALFRSVGRDALYVAAEPDDVAAFVAACDERWRGFSITAPFKEAAFALATTHDEWAARSRAANTLLRRVDGWHGTNTDAPAIRRVIGRALCGEARIQDTTAVVVGSGGAARAALVALRGAQLAICARNAPERAALAREFGAREVASLEALGDARFDVLVHCTPLGSAAQPGSIAIPDRAFAQRPIVLDAVYRPARTQLLARAEHLGARPIGGREWFLEQARLQAELFLAAPAVGAPSASSPPAHPAPAGPTISARSNRTPAIPAESIPANPARMSARSSAEPSRADTQVDPAVLAQAFDEAIAEDAFGRAGARATEAAAVDSQRARTVLTAASRPAVIALVGLRASGKTTVGRLLAQRIGARFVDLDDEIGRRHGAPGRKTAGDVLAERGEDRFRELEHTELSRALLAPRESGPDAPAEPVVIATGGGIVESAVNRDLLARSAWCVWLRAPLEELLRRLEQDPGKRPLLAGSSRAEETAILAARRDPWYREIAGLILENDAGTPPEAAAESAFQAWNQARSGTRG